MIGNSKFKIQSSKLVLIILAVTLTGAVFFFFRQTPPTPIPDSSPKTLPSQNNQNEPPKIISTKPDPLEDAIISATETVEITFNRPLENVGEFKVRIEPKIDIKAQLSGDRKTARIIPTKPFELGTTYTLFIGTETKFDGVGRWGMEKIFHFKTIQYRGI